MLFSEKANTKTVAHCRLLLETIRLASRGRVFDETSSFDAAIVYTTSKQDAEILDVSTDLQDNNSNELAELLYKRSQRVGELSIIEPWMDRLDIERDTLPSYVKRNWVEEVAIDIVDTKSSNSNEVYNIMQRGLLDVIIVIPRNSAPNLTLPYALGRDEVFVLSYQGGGLISLGLSERIADHL